MFLLLLLLLQSPQAKCLRHVRLRSVPPFLPELDSRRLDERVQEVERDEDHRGEHETDAEHDAVRWERVRVVVSERGVQDHRGQKQTLEKKKS